MKIKKGCTASTSDFWYDLTDGGYLKVGEMLEDKDDINEVEYAIQVIREFQQSCEDQIEDFYMQSTIVLLGGITLRTRSRHSEYKEEGEMNGYKPNRYIDIWMFSGMVGWT